MLAVECGLVLGGGWGMAGIGCLIDGFTAGGIPYGELGPRRKWH